MYVRRGAASILVRSVRPDLNLTWSGPPNLSFWAPLSLPAGGIGVASARGRSLGFSRFLGDLRSVLRRSTPATQPAVDASQPARRGVSALEPRLDLRSDVASCLVAGTVEIKNDERRRNARKI